MSPRHFSLMAKGYNEAKVADYRVARMIMYTMVKLLGDPKSSPKSPEALWELPGDKSSEVTDEEYREMFKRLSK
jgi:hypothetical protein